MGAIYSNKNVRAISLGFFFIFFGFDASQQYLIPLLKLEGKEEMAFTSLLLIYGAFLLSGLIAPNLIPKLGLKKSLFLGSAAYVLFILSLTTLHEPIIYASAIIVGIGAGFLWNASGQIIAAASGAHTLGSNLGLQYSSLLLGAMAGVGTGALLVSRISFEGLFLFFALAAGLGSLFLLQVEDLPPTQPDRKWRIGYVFHKKFLLLFPLVFAGYFLIAHTFTAINLVILNLFGLTWVGILSTMLKITIVAGALVIGKISDIYQKEKILYVLLLTAIIGIALFLLGKTVIVFALGIIFIGLFISSVYPLTLSLLKEASSKEEFQFALGSFHVYLTIAVLSSIGLSSAIDPKLSFAPALLAIVLAFPALQLFKKQNLKKAEGAE